MEMADPPYLTKELRNLYYSHRPMYFEANNTIAKGNDTTPTLCSRLEITQTTNQITMRMANMEALQIQFQK
ncbi:conserved hypothetical protein [Ricinus communis]|uniref:Uncharacterized protein n=1 Tax=Ricinus communis TaxID=3988 RepID=B9RYM3_RICCO|nr:conserved hypothetical protein [Ricinus communis]